MRRKTTMTAFAAFALLALSACGGQTATSTTTTTAQATTATEQGGAPAPSDTDTPPEVDTTTPSPDPQPVDVVALAVDANPTVAAVAMPELPEGTAGELSIIAHGAKVGRTGSLPVVLRNMTDLTLTRLSVSGMARDGDGALVGSGEDQGFHPATLAPGELAYGYVFFGDGLPKDTTFELTANGREADLSDLGRIDLEITEHNATSDKVLVMVTNTTDETVEGPISVSMTCFDEDGTPTQTHSAFADQDAVEAGGAASASIKFWGESPCERYVIGAGGYSY